MVLHIRTPFLNRVLTSHNIAFILVLTVSFVPFGSFNFSNEFLVPMSWLSPERCLEVKVLFLKMHHCDTFLSSDFNLASSFLFFFVCELTDCVIRKD